MDITLISVPFAQDRPFQSMGRAPAALRDAGLRERLQDAGVRVKAEHEIASLPGEGDRLERLGRLGAGLAAQVGAAYRNGTLPVVLGGDCLNAIGVCAGLGQALDGAALGVAWFDAHGDFNTPETTLSGYLGGMPLAAVCGRGLEALRAAIGLSRPVAEDRVLMLGVRDLDPPEKELLDSTAVKILAPDKVEVEHVAALARERFASTEGLYLHIDIDALDPQEAPGVNFPTPNGLSLQATLAAARALRQFSPLLAVTLAAIDPEKDPEGKTVETGIRLLAGILAADW